MTAHYFVAIPLTDTLKNHFSVWQEELKEELPYKKWTNKLDLHITLKFLGAVEHEQLTRLQQELKQVGNANAFSTKAGGEIGRASCRDRGEMWVSKVGD